MGCNTALFTYGAASLADAKKSRTAGLLLTEPVYYTGGTYLAHSMLLLLVEVLIKRFKICFELPSRGHRSMQTLSISLQVALYCH